MIDDGCRGVRKDLFDLLLRIAEVSFGFHAVNQDRDLIVDSCSLHLRLNSTDVNLFLVAHDHHLPLHLVFGDSTVHRATEFFRISLFGVLYIIKLDLRSCLNNDLRAAAGIAYHRYKVLPLIGNRLFCEVIIVNNNLGDIGLVLKLSCLCFCHSLGL